MRIELKDFQEDAVRAMMKSVYKASRDARDGDATAIILSSPTGSGKTVTITALLERVLEGDETYDGDPEAIFLWLSDSPELNTQSRDKILTQSSVFREEDLIIVEPPFSQERFGSGKIYFLNTQKLGKDNLLTKTGDGRDFTIWQTIESTAQVEPSHFYLIIDEAHRGMNLSASELRQAQTIVQKFIFGDRAVGLSPVKLVIGLSATPERFARVIEGSARATRPYNVPPAAVRESGLLKERIILYCPEESQPSDWTMLSQAVKRWSQVRKDWRKYCKDQGVEPVEPVLVVQVEDGTEGKLTRTDLTQAIEILEREAGRFGRGALAHCFEIEGPVEAGGYVIRKTEPSKIELDPTVRVVFFKMALTTGWDCPRAEVMMSFRRAQDHTLIAQLVGRMVRTPLARRIEGNEILNTVSLYLPHYDRHGLRAIIERLNDPENSAPTEVVEGHHLVTVKRDPTHEDIFSILARMPSYAVEQIPRTSNTRRLVKLARLLNFDEIDSTVWGKAKGLVVKTIADELARLRLDPRFARVYKANQTIEVREVQIEAGEWREVDEGRVTKVKASPENIDDLFDICGRMLGEGLHREFWKKERDRQDPQRTKLELFGVLQDKSVWARIERVARDRLDALYEEHKDRINALPTSKREEYNRIRRRAKEPQIVSLMFPPAYEVSRQERLWDKHLYVDDSGNFPWNANTWESAVLESEMNAKGFVAWLRNEPRKSWSLCIPYGRGEDRPMYPDMIVFRKIKGSVQVDLLDPHDPGLRDAVDKAVGLARYAGRHGDFFGRIELVILAKDGEIKRLDVKKEDIREKVLQVKDMAYLQALFERSV